MTEPLPLEKIFDFLRSQAVDFRDLDTSFQIRQVRLARVVLLMDRSSGLLKAVFGAEDWAAFLRGEKFIFPWQARTIRCDFGTVEEFNADYLVKLAKGLEPRQPE